jgi:hypothetical protein
MLWGKIFEKSWRHAAEQTAWENMTG